MDVGSTSDAAGAGGGLAALMVAANPSLTPEQMKAAMIAGVDIVPSMQGKLVSNVRRSRSNTFLYDTSGQLALQLWVCHAALLIY